MVGPFCHTCGQQNTGKKTTIKDMIAALLSGFFSLERSAFGTMWKVLVNPKAVIHNFWQGYRNYYYRPGSLIFYVIFVIGLHLNFVNAQILGVNVSLSGVSKEMAVIFSPQVFFLLLILPLLSSATYLTHRNQKRSFPEHFISATYVFATWAVIYTIISDTLLLLFGIDPSTLLFLALLFIWSSITHTKSSKWYWVALNTLFEILVFILIIVVFLSLLYLVSPGSFKLNQSTTQTSMLLNFNLTECFRLLA